MEEYSPTQTMNSFKFEISKVSQVAKIQGTVTLSLWQRHNSFKKYYEAVSTPDLYRSSILTLSSNVSHYFVPGSTASLINVVLIIIILIGKNLIFILVMKVTDQHIFNPSDNFDITNNQACCLSVRRQCIIIDQKINGTCKSSKNIDFLKRKCIIYSQKNQNQWKFKPQRDTMINPGAYLKGV